MLIRRDKMTAGKKCPLVKVLCLNLCTSIHTISLLSARVRLHRQVWWHAPGWCTQCCQQVIILDMWGEGEGPPTRFKASENGSRGRGTRRWRKDDVVISMSWKTVGTYRKLSYHFQVSKVTGSYIALAVICSQTLLSSFTVNAQRPCSICDNTAPFAARTHGNRNWQVWHFTKVARFRSHASLFVTRKTTAASNTDLMEQWVVHNVHLRLVGLERKATMDFCRHGKCY